MNANHRSTLLIATPEQVENFLPSSILDQMRELFTHFEIKSPTSLSEPELQRLIAEFNPEVLITGWKMKSLPLTPPSRLKYVCHLSGSVRSFFPLSYFDKNIRLTNWGNSISPCIAEMTLFLLLSCLRRSRTFSDIMHHDLSWTWDFSQSQTLFNKKIGIHGYGNIARILIELLKPFGASISVYSEPVPKSIIEKAGLTPLQNLEELFSKNEIVIELEALTEQSRSSVTFELLNKIPKGGVFINTGRGQIVDELALLKIAKTGKIQIGLDVFHNEPLPKESSLRDLENVQLYPHMSGPTSDFSWHAGALALKNIQAYFSGEAFIDGEITEEIYERIT